MVKVWVTVKSSMSFVLLAYKPLLLNLDVLMILVKDSDL